METNFCKEHWTCRCKFPTNIQSNVTPDCLFCKMPQRHGSQVKQDDFERAVQELCDKTVDSLKRKKYSTGFR